MNLYLLHYQDWQSLRRLLVKNRLYLLNKIQALFFFLIVLAQEPIDFSDIDDYSASNNLLSVFLEYCSIIQQFSKSKSNLIIFQFDFSCCSR